MSDYTPDRWVIVEINSEHGKIRKILGSWYGGYASSDSWRFSSGITEVIDKDDHYEIHNHSGSIYTCYKNSIGMSGYTASVYDNLLRQFKEGDTMSIVEDYHSDKGYKVGTLEAQAEFEQKRNYHYGESND